MKSLRLEETLLDRYRTLGWRISGKLVIFAKGVVRASKTAMISLKYCFHPQRCCGTVERERTYVNVIRNVRS
jgi:hypothetical protein